MVRMISRSFFQGRGARGEALTTNPSFAVPYFSNTSKVVETQKVCKTNMLVHNSKRANLSATRKERIMLPIHGDGCRINEFLSHPLGIQAVINRSAMQSCQSLDSNTYRCILPKLQLLNFEAAPVLDLRVTPTDQDCIVEMLSCKFQGSEMLERQNEHFSAFMTNCMTWGTDYSNPFLEVDVKLDLSLEIYTQPFTFLPSSAIEVPGNVVMQSLVDRLVPLLLEQLLQDYDKWASERHQHFS